MQADIASRQGSLRGLMRRKGVGAMLLTARPNVRYFSGFTGEDSYLLVGQRWSVLLTDSRFTEQAGKECPSIPALIRTGKMTDAIVKALAGRAVRTLGVEGAYLPLSLYERLGQALRRVKLKALTGEVDDLRQVKDAGELSAIRKAVRAAERALLDLMAGGRTSFVGRSEQQVAAELEYRMRLRGAERPSFETIVACGAHAAMPHYRPGSTRIRPNQPVLIDWGAVVGGYCSDLTRVVFTGKIPPRLGRIYEVVRQAQEKGFAAVKAGVSCEAVDASARDYIVSQGFGEAFGHGLGHGIGLEIHEAPRLGRRATEPLRAGTVVTIEPGIYLPDVGGVRIEDDVLVTETGCKKLSSLPTELAAMVLH